MGAIQVNVGPPSRGGASQSAQTLQLKSVTGSFAWGSSPGQASLTYVGTSVPVSVGAAVDFQIGAHYFAGVCVSDTEVQSSNGTLRTIVFQDFRYYLAWDWVFGAWNMPEVRLINGVRVKRYWHIFPQDWSTQTKTYTLSPLPAWQIVAQAFLAPTVFTKWAWDLTGDGLFSAGLLNGAIYEIDANSGMRLDAFLNVVCDKTGLVFMHAPLPTEIGSLGDFRLVFTRKGYGLLPLPFPANSNDRRQGLSLTENPWNICVVGDRNKYQYLNVPMEADWSAPWEQFLDMELFVLDIFNNETDPVSGNPYNAYPSDPDNWFGYGAAKARALELTVNDYIALRGARSGNTDAATFADNRKYAGRWRCDLPAMLYIQNLVFRAFRPDLDAIENWQGGSMPLDSAPIADSLLCRVYLDYATGNMTADTTEPVDGNGVLAVLGYQAGEDLFRFAQPDRINASFFSASTRGWTTVNFQIDDSGEGVRFIIAEQPVFTSDNLLTTVNGYNVLNAAFTLQVPQCQAALVFEGERYTYWKGTGMTNSFGVWDQTQPMPGRTKVEPVNGLEKELVADLNNPGVFNEIPYADNQFPDQKALTLAESLLLQQRWYLAGGYNLKWNPALDISEFGTPLVSGETSQFDRVEVQASDAGILEVVDFTMERSRDRFEPERELDRKSVQNTLFPGQQELRQEDLDQKRLNAGLRQIGTPLLGQFQKLLRGEVDGNQRYLRFIPGATLPSALPAGTPLVINPQPAGQSGNATAVAPASVTAATTNQFAGVTIRHNESTNRAFCVQTIGDTYARVMGPVNANDPIGLSAAGGSDFATNGAYLVGSGTPAVGLALEPITGNNVQLIKVRLGSGGGGGDPRFYWFIQTGMGNTNGVANVSWGWDGRVTDTMAANNLTNPAGLLDWVAFFTRDVDDYPNYGNPNAPATIHAGFITDPTIQSNEYEHYQDLFGDPSVSTTLLGDLLHHKGTVYAVQVSKTKIDVVSGKGYAQVIKGSFNGYATFAADMAALGVSVTAKTAAGVATTLTDPKGILQLSNANPTAYDVYLVPTGTNFLKQGDVQSSIVTLTGMATYAIESAVFEVDANAMDPGGLGVMRATPNLGVTPNQLVFPPVVTTAANTKSYYDWMSLTGPWSDPTGTPIVVTGPNITTMTQPAWATAPVMGGIHTVTVASLTSLSWWGGPGNAHDTLSASLQLTPQGLALVWSEQLDGTAPALPSLGGLGSTYLDWTLGNLSLVQNHCIYFRGHGWGYTASKLGSQAAGFLSCREPRYQGGNNFANEANNQKSPGSDFTFGPLDCTKVEVTTLTRNLGVFNWGGSRFWQTKRGGDNLIQLLTALSLPQFNVSAATTTGGNHVFTLQNFDGTPATPSTMTLPYTWVDNRLGSAWQGFTEGAMPVTEGAMPSLCMALLPEMYNHIAATINRASKGVPLDYRALLWNFDNHILNFDPRFNPVYPASGAGMGYIGGNSFTYFGGPVPVNQFCSFDSGSVFESFCMAMGVPVLGAADFPDQDIIAAGHRTTAAIMADQVNASTSNAVIDLTNATYSVNPITGNLTEFTCPGCPISVDVSVSITAELLKNGLLLKGMPSGSLCCGTFDPNLIALGSGPPFPPPLAYPVFPSNPLPKNYFVAANDQTAPGTMKKGDLFFADGTSLSLGGNPNDATDPTGAVWNLVTSFTAPSTDASGNPTTVNYRWLAQADVEKFMLTQGFTLNLEEVYIPLTLTYLEDPFVTSQSAGGGTIHNVVVNAMFSGDTTQIPEAISLLSSRTASIQEVVQLVSGESSFGPGAIKPSGTWLGWYVDVGPDSEIPSVMNAKWKLLNTNPSTGNFASFYAPLPVTDVKSRLHHSNLCRCLEAYGGLTASVVYPGSAEFVPNPTQLAYYGFGFGGLQSGGYGIVDLVLGAGFGSNSADPSNNVNPGQAPSAANVAFLATEFVLSGPDGTPFKCMARAIIGQGVGLGAYQEYDNHDNYDAYVLHTFGLPRAVSVSLVGQPSWICPVDWWGSADGIAIVDGLVWGPGGPGFGISGGLVPWTALSAPANLTLGAGTMNPTPNGGSDVCTILTTPAQPSPDAPNPQQRYTALFNLARVAIDLTVGTTPSTTQLLASSSQFASSSQQL